MKARLIILTSVWAACMGSGCGEEPEVPPVITRPSPKPKASTTAADGTDTTVTPKVAPYVYAYDPIGKRDPFRTPSEEGRPAAQNTSCQEPLCQWSLEQLTLVAVVSGDSNPFAMVEDPERRGHIIKRNQKIGRMGGRVTQVLRDRVIVTEYWTLADGKLNPRPTVMKLADEDARSPVLDLLTGSPL